MRWKLTCYLLNILTFVEASTRPFALLMNDVSRHDESQEQLRCKQTHLLFGQLCVLRLNCLIFDYFVLNWNLWRRL